MYKLIIKGVFSLIFLAGFLIGFCLMISEPTETATTMEIIKVNGGGIALECISLLILSAINKGEEKPESKGGDYYGIR